jgi:hypothetical protein
LEAADCQDAVDNVLLVVDTSLDDSSEVDNFN